MNNILRLINALILSDEDFKDFRIVHTTNHEIRILYKTYIVIVQYEGEQIKFVNGFKTLPKYIMDKLQCIDFAKQPWIHDHYHHHDSHEHHHHHHWDGWCKTIPACNHDDYRFNSDIMQRPHPDITLVHERLDSYCDYIEQDAKDGRIVIKFIDGIIDIRNNPNKEFDPIYQAEKKNYPTKVEVDPSQNAQNDKLRVLEDNRANFEEVDPIWNAEKKNYYTKNEFNAQQAVQDERISALEENPLEETDPIWVGDRDNYDTKEAVNNSQDLQDIRIKALEDNAGGIVEEKDPIWEAEKQYYYMKAETYSREVFDASQLVQDNRIKALEDGGGTPIDTYTKAEIDAQQKAQDETIALKADSETVGITIGMLKADIELLKKAPAQMWVTTNLIDAPEGLEDTILTYMKDDIFNKSDTFSINEAGDTILNKNPNDSTNGIMIDGIIAMYVELETSGEKTTFQPSISCSRAVDPNLQKTLTIDLTTDSQVCLPFKFILNDEAQFQLQMSFFDTGIKTISINKSNISITKLK